MKRVYLSFLSPGLKYVVQSFAGVGRSIHAVFCQNMSHMPEHLQLVSACNMAAAADTNISREKKGVVRT